MSSSWDTLVAAYHRGVESCKFGQTPPQFSYYPQTQQVVLEIDGVCEGHDEGDFLDRLSSNGDFWSGGPAVSWPATPTPSEMDRQEQAHHQWAAIGAIGQGSQSDSIPIGGTSPPAGYESAANAWQWTYSPPSIAHPDQSDSEWHITKPTGACLNPAGGGACLDPARWVWEQLRQGHSEDDMRRSLAAIGADARFTELCLSRITWLQQQGRKTAPQRLTKWTRNS